MKLPATKTSPRFRSAVKLSGLAAAALALPLLMPAGAAPTASAGDTRWSFTVNNHHVHHDYRHHNRKHYSPGYYKKVWVPPVYRTRYGDCGRAFRVCVRDGYFKNVYVSGSHYQPRYRSSFRRSHYRDRSSCRY